MEYNEEVMVRITNDIKVDLNSDGALRGSYLNWRLITYLTDLSCARDLNECIVLTSAG